MEREAKRRLGLAVLSIVTLVVVGSVLADNRSSHSSSPSRRSDQSESAPGIAPAGTIPEVADQPEPVDDAPDTTSIFETEDWVRWAAGVLAADGGAAPPESTGPDEPTRAEIDAFWRAMAEAAVAPSAGSR